MNMKLFENVELGDESLNEENLELTFEGIDQDYDTLLQYTDTLKLSYEAISDLQDSISLESMSDEINDDKVKLALEKQSLKNLNLALEKVNLPAVYDPAKAQANAGHPFDNEGKQGIIEKIIEAIKKFVAKIVKTIKKLYTKLIIAINTNRKILDKKIKIYNTDMTDMQLNSIIRETKNINVLATLTTMNMLNGDTTGNGTIGIVEYLANNDDLLANSLKDIYTVGNFINGGNSDLDLLDKELFYTLNKSYEPEFFYKGLGTAAASMDNLKNAILKGIEYKEPSQSDIDKYVSEMKNTIISKVGMKEVSFKVMEGDSLVNRTLSKSTNINWSILGANLLAAPGEYLAPGMNVSKVKDNLNIISKLYSDAKTIVKNKEELNNKILKQINTDLKTLVDSPYTDIMRSSLNINNVIMNTVSMGRFVSAVRLSSQYVSVLP